MKARHSLHSFGLLLSLVLLLGGCGHKGPPRPLLKPQPAAVGQLQILQLGSALQLSWTIPQHNQDGTPLKHLAGFNLYRMGYDPQNECPECRDTSILLRRVELGYLQGARREDNRIFVSDSDQLQPGRGYRYRVVAVTEDGLEGVPATIKQVFQPPAAAPENFQAVGHDRLVRLEWTAPAVAAGAELVGYNLYRSLGNAPLAPMPINSKPLPKTSFEDFQVDNGQTYRYGVRSLERRDGALVASPLAGPLAAVPQPGK